MTPNPIPTDNIQRSDAARRVTGAVNSAGVDRTKNAVEADRKPVQGARSQDNNPDANDARGIITEGADTVIDNQPA